MFTCSIIACLLCKPEAGVGIRTGQLSTNYYISPKGNDANDGSFTHPWESAVPLSRTKLKPGDSVLFEGGHPYQGTLTLPPHTNGNAEKPIVITSYGKGRAALRGGNGPGIMINNCNFVQLRDLIVSGNGRKAGNVTSGISFNRCRNITVDSIDVSGFQKSGMLLQNCSDVSVEKVMAHDNGFAGIAVQGEDFDKKECRNIVIRYCTAKNNPGDPVNTSNHSGNGIIVSQCVNVKIAYCTATGNGWDMPRQGNGPVGIWAWDADSVIIEHSLSFRNMTSKGGEDGGGFDFDGGVTNSVIQYCLSYENAGSGIGLFEYDQAGPWHNNTVRYNISINDGNVSSAKAGIYIWNTSITQPLTKCFLYNNTVYNDRNGAVRFARESNHSDFFFFNNIFVGNREIVSGNIGTAKYLGNAWWSIADGFNVNQEKNFKKWCLANTQELTGETIAGLNLDPALINPGRHLPADARSISDFAAFKARGDRLIRGGIDFRQLFKVSGGDIDFNGNKALPKGIGASF